MKTKEKYPFKLDRNGYIVIYDRPSYIEITYPIRVEKELCEFYTLQNICEWADQLNITYDQMMVEYNSLVAYDKLATENRRQSLRKEFEKDLADWNKWNTIYQVDINKAYLYREELKKKDMEKQKEKLEKQIAKLQKKINTL